MNLDDIKKRNLSVKGPYLPYNPDLTGRARELRKNMTPAEKRLWFELLHAFPLKVYRQRPIDHYIVDFYCPSLRLVIEVDGEQHISEAAKCYDGARDAVLASYCLHVLRLPNEEVMNEFGNVRKIIEAFLQDPPVTP
ncbi:MAG: endonuclease domain-containing protein [Candidatus Latescibacteria bacterium]|nr:endonuclease domain-containing protein [Candidatus Latescibacterota bacterium]